MVMEEFDELAEKQIGDEFYEKIEAPKFVDFTIPDHYRPDDRYWFCLRVGCDQKHEEEMDSESIYKDFVLRVMAARSPNIKIRKMLTRKPSALKCPQTAPAKPSKSRVSRLTGLSSIVRKLDVAEDKPKPPLKLTETPKPSSKKPSSTAKALTTPRNRKPALNTNKFMSVRVSKPTVKKTNTVAKALVFRSPRRKIVRIKTSLELKTPVKKLCTAVSKLEIGSERKKKTAKSKTTPVGKLCRDSEKKQPLEQTLKKQFRGRVVKSRVYDSLHSLTPKGKETKPEMNKKREKAEKNSEQNDSSDMEVEERPMRGSLEPCSISVGSKNEDEVATDRALEQSDVSLEERVKFNEDKENEPSWDVKKEKVKVIGKTNISKDGNDDKENTLPSGETENSVAIERGDEEHVSASDENRESNVRSEAELKTNRQADKVNQVTKKPLKKSSLATPGPQEAKYKKPKPTNPKPFRLRTDERSILKEATLEKKLVTPFREITTSMKPGLKSSLRRKNQNSSQVSDQKNENGQEQSSGIVDMENPKIRTISKKCLTEGTKSSEKKSERTKSFTTTPQGIGSNRRKTAKLTIPKEPSFHAMHVPRSCSRKAVA